MNLSVVSGEFTSVFQENRAPSYNDRLGIQLHILWCFGYCYQNKKTGFRSIKTKVFIEQMAKNNSVNNGDRYRIHKIFQMNCFVPAVSQFKDVSSFMIYLNALSCLHCCKLS